MKFLKLTIDNAIDELLYADGTTCERLKKAAMIFIMKNGQEALASSTYVKIDESPRLRKEDMLKFAKYCASIFYHSLDFTYYLVYFGKINEFVFLIVT